MPTAQPRRHAGHHQRGRQTASGTTSPRQAPATRTHRTSQAPQTQGQANRTAGHHGSRRWGASRTSRRPARTAICCRYPGEQLCWDGVLRTNRYAPSQVFRACPLTSCRSGCSVYSWLGRAPVADRRVQQPGCAPLAPPIATGTLWSRCSLPNAAGRPTATAADGVGYEPRAGGRARRTGHQPGDRLLTSRSMSGAVLRAGHASMVADNQSPRMIHEETAQRPTMPCVGPAGKRSNSTTTRQGQSWQES
jgi:hypothetical protein